MDVAAYLQRFESSISTYVGDDPLEQWDKFVKLLEQHLPPNSSSQLSVVLSRLVETFLNVNIYANDDRYVNYCIQFASAYSDPIAMYSHLFSKGVGTRCAALYSSWAQQLEQRGLNDQAEALYQKALENKAQPADLLLDEYRQFQTRTRLHVAASAGNSSPLRNSLSVNVMSSQSALSAQKTETTAAECSSPKPVERRYVVTISRSEYSGKLPPSNHENLVSAYDKEALHCEGSELCFEEVRAQRYVQKQLQQQQLRQQQEQQQIQQQQLQQQQEQEQERQQLQQERQQLQQERQQLQQERQQLQQQEQEWQQLQQERQQLQQQEQEWQQLQQERQQLQQQERQQLQQQQERQQLQQQERQQLQQQQELQQQLQQQELQQQLQQQELQQQLQQQELQQQLQQQELQQQLQQQERQQQLQQQERQQLQQQELQQLQQQQQQQQQRLQQQQQPQQRLQQQQIQQQQQQKLQAEAEAVALHVSAFEDEETVTNSNIWMEMRMKKMSWTRGTGHDKSASLLPGRSVGCRPRSEPTVITNDSTSPGQISQRDTKDSASHAPVTSASQSQQVPAAAPASVPAAAPVSVPAAAPVSVPAAAPVSVPAAAPVSVPAAALVSVPAAAPVSVPAAAPVSVPAAAPVSVPAAAPVSVPAAAPVSVPAAAPVSVPAAAPVSVPAAAPVSVPAAAPVSVPAAAPVSVPAAAPVSVPAAVEMLSELNASHRSLVSAPGVFHCAPHLMPYPENYYKNSEEPMEPEYEADLSQCGAVNLSRVTPNTSLGYIQATPSRALPSPTVNTREALDVIMDMFQAPTLLEDQFPNAAEGNFDIIYTRKAAATSAPFTIFQDDQENDQENISAPPAVEGVKPLRALLEHPKPNDSPSDLAPEESTLWGAQFLAQHSLAACPNSTSDFALLAHFVSTPFTHKTPMSNNFFPDQEITEGTEEDCVRRYTKKLSPIIEQSPSEEKPRDAAVASTQGTFVGEAAAMTTSCTTIVQPPPPTALSFRDHTLCPGNTSAHRSTGPQWEVYTSTEPPAAVLLPPQDVPMSPESGPRSDWLSIPSPEMFEESDLDAFLSPKRPGVSDLSPDVPMSPQVESDTDCYMQSPDRDIRPPLELSMRTPRAPLELSTRTPRAPLELSMSRTPRAPLELSMSRTPRAPLELSMSRTPRAPLELSTRNPRAPLELSTRTPRALLELSMRTPGRGASRMTLVSDPWNNELISDLLSQIEPPLTAHPRYVTWQWNIPDIAPKMTLSMGHSSLRVDCVLGQGAFAKVFQATDPATSEKMVLKVQKPANPWEFYINSQLDCRVPPSVRHFYSTFHSAHLFKNGSVLLGELHSYGTLLNAVNLYRTLGDKVMPQPLVLYFAVCILHIVEQLHSVGIVHADVKPDNFLLGERFLEIRGFDQDDLDHGLVLIDFGQSIDMKLFPPDTAFTAKCLTSGFQCTEMQTGGPWNYQTDYYGVAGTVYCMLFGTYMQVLNDGGVWKTSGVFRRNPHSDLWQEFFHTLLNVPDCSSLPDLRQLRHKLLSTLQQNYSSKLPSLQSRLVVLLLESCRNQRR